jgi:TetR/AcrR family transcriptional regulator, cholesterol catabolism regulator
MARSDEETQPHPALTKRQAEIRRVATELFAKQGYRAVGMRAIADAVGIRTSSLYYHFESKEEILYSIGLDITRDFVEQHLLILDGPGPASERLAELVRQHVEFFVQHRLEEMVGKSELRELSAEHFEAVTHHKRVYQRRIQSFIAEYAAAGEFQVTDPRITAIALLDMVNGINNWYREGGRLRLGQVAEHYASLALQLVGSREAPRAAMRTVA